MTGHDHSTILTDPVWDPGLSLSFAAPVYSADDGLGPLDDLSQAGDALVAVGTIDGGVMRLSGSGFMAALGMAVTASHVLDEYSPVRPALFTTFLPAGGARVWRPFQSNRCVGQDDSAPPGDTDRRLQSDISLVSCVLSSAAHREHPLMLAPMSARLPLPGERLWAVGFREGEFDDDSTPVAPLVSSGQVSACHPDGRGRMLRSPCVEVGMETVGGMSGGPVYDEWGMVVGIVSSSLGGEGGPTFVTLLWDVLRLSVSCPWPRGRWPSGDIDLIRARDLGMARLAGELRRGVDGDVVLAVGGAEREHFRRHGGRP